ncbi:hypothetical protein [Rhizobium sp. Leaf386]|uniref:hypothetical protein n=1 Tax=Rhizobium sp. Leaf386 TaxID=1736359 RepID=UPI0007137666|nr:hypothetical protein [Rhizobium sp. Leaf386]KQS90322.1 hypothetical protein ASG50_07660 [Rhizobium sp. Leaf386]
MATDKIPTWVFFCFSAFAVTACVAITIAPKKSVVAAPTCDKASAHRVLTYWRDLRVVRDVRSATEKAYVEVNTRAWAEIGRKGQISIAFAAYCSVADANGSGSALVEGSLQESLGSVVDGVWSR